MNEPTSFLRFIISEILEELETTHQTRLNTSDRQASIDIHDLVRSSEISWLKRLITMDSRLWISL